MKRYYFNIRIGKTKCIYFHIRKMKFILTRT